MHPLQVSHDIAEPSRALLPAAAPGARNAGSGSDLRGQLSQRLQTSLEIDVLLRLLQESINSQIPLDGLQYRYPHPGSAQPIMIGRAGRHQVTYRLQLDSEVLGSLTLQRDGRFLTSELEQLGDLLSCLRYPLRNALLYHAALQSAIRDPLTGAANRTALQQILPRELERARLQRCPLALLMLDLDHFKQVNDLYGHQWGDEALKAVAGTLTRSLRRSDHLFRYGGEEFMVLLSDTQARQAAGIAERLCRSVRRLDFRIMEHPLSLSVSIGVAALLGGESQDSLLRRADQALYAAKRDGRNRIVEAREG